MFQMYCEYINLSQKVRVQDFTVKKPTLEELKVTVQHTLDHARSNEHIAIRLIAIYDKTGRETYLWTAKKGWKAL